MLSLKIDCGARHGSALSALLPAQVRAYDFRTENVTSRILSHRVSRTDNILRAHVYVITAPPVDRHQMRPTHSFEALAGRMACLRLDMAYKYSCFIIGSTMYDLVGSLTNNALECKKPRSRMKSI
jgi:hypothetical protein